MIMDNFFVMNMSFEKYIILLISYIIAISLITYFANITFAKFGLLDIPNERKSHKKPIPISGGAILVISILLTYFFLENIIKINIKFYYNIILISFIFFILGLIDDIKNPRTIIKVLIIYNSIS